MKIRKYNDNDKNFIIELSERFTDFEFLSSRDVQKHKEKQKEMAYQSTKNNPQGIFIAEDNGKYLGYIEVREYLDYFTNEKQGYVHSIAVVKDCEGKGIGSELMEKAEEWSREKGYKNLVLQLFTSNIRAMNFYKNLGFEDDIIVLSKQI